MNEILAVVGTVALRVTVIYVALLRLLRLGGRRELAQLTPADMLLLLLLSEAVSPALTGGQDSIGSGLFGAALLIALTWLIGMFTFRSRKFEALVEGRTIVLVRNGKLDQAQLRSMRITDQQLRTSMHEHGVMRIDQIAVAYIEPSGKVTIIKQDEAPEPKGAAARGPDRDEGPDGDDRDEAPDGAEHEASAEEQLEELRAQLAKLEQTLRRRSSRGAGSRGAPRRETAPRERTADRATELLDRLT